MFDLLNNSRVAPEDAYIASYYAIRLLQYRHELTPSRYSSFLRAHEVTLSPRKLNLAIRLIREIELHEHASISDLPQTIVNRYVTRLATAAGRRARNGARDGETETKQLIAQLERETAGSIRPAPLHLRARPAKRIAKKPA